MPSSSLRRFNPLPDTCAMAQWVSQLATTALLREMELTPKPGLVDQANAGAHHDMDLGTFRASLAAISPWFARFFQKGVDGAHLPAPTLLRQLRMEGLACERAMLRATAGVNTHKGSVFSMGLLCAGAGRLVATGQAVAADNLCAEVAQMCAGLVQTELREPSQAQTAGERLYWQHGLTGARGEAQSGFATARLHGVPAYQRARAQGCHEEQALLEALLRLMAYNADTNLVSRGGLAGLDLVQREARRLLAAPVATFEARQTQLRVFDALLIRQHLSPGGSADLLAVSWFLLQLEPADAAADAAQPV